MLSRSCRASVVGKGTYYYYYHHHYYTTTTTTTTTTTATTTSHPPPPTNHLAPRPIVIVIINVINENDSCRKCRGSGALSVTAAEVADAHLP